MKPRRVAGDNSDELFKFARSYLSTAFPNPNRDGCPADASLVALASNPEAGDPAIGEHISCCSPCFSRYMELLSAERSLGRAGWKSWILGRPSWVPAVLVVAITIAIYIGIRSVTARRRSPERQNYSRLVMNLDPFSRPRAPAEGKQPTNRRLILPHRPTTLVLELPLGSERGSYRVSINSHDKSVWSASVAAKALDHRLYLETKADFSRIPAGEYLLLVESDAGTQISAPVLLVDRRNPQGNSTNSRMSRNLTKPSC
jgi:hypothetical protein